MARTLIFNTSQIRTDLLAYLRASGGFTHFKPLDVANYEAIGQVHLVMTHGHCEKTYIFDVREPQMLAGDCKPGHEEQPPDEFWAEVETIGKEFASIVTANSTVQVIRRRDPSLESPY